LAIEVDASLPPEQVIRVFDQVMAWRGLPQALRLDNGPELLAERFMRWRVDRIRIPSLNPSTAPIAQKC
jgi:putative transposase